MASSNNKKKLPANKEHPNIKFIKKTKLCIPINFLATCSQRIKATGSSCY